MIKLSVNETKWSSLLARTRALILYISIWKFDFGSEKLLGHSRNGSQHPSCFWCLTGKWSRFTRRQHRYHPSTTGSWRYIRGDLLLHITIRYCRIQVSSVKFWISYYNLQYGEDTYHRSCFSSAWIPYVQCIPFCRLRDWQVNRGRIELGAQVTVSSFLPCEQRPFDLI